MNDNSENETDHLPPPPENVSYIKTLCPLCDGSIEFPALLFGELMNCPHCKNLIELGKPFEPPIRLPPLPKSPAEPIQGVWNRTRKSNPQWQIAGVLCVLILGGTAFYIYQDNKAQRIKQAEQPAAWQPPATDKIISETDAFGSAHDPLEILKQKKSLILDEADRLSAGDVFDQVAAAATNPNGTPAGAWAATLVRIPNAIESNLFKDPATGKLVHLVNGQLFEEKDPYMALSILETSNLSALRLAEQQQQPKVVVQWLPPLQTHDYMNDYYQHRFQQQISSPSFVSPSVVVPATSYDPNSLANPYGAGSPYKADGLMNPYSRYGSRYSSQSWRNPYATDTPKLHDSQGNYRGKLSSNPYDLDSTANPYGRYGSPYSPDSINNPYGLGSPYNTTPIYVVPSR